MSEKAVTVSHSAASELTNLMGTVESLLQAYEDSAQRILDSIKAVRRLRTKRESLSGDLIAKRKSRSQAVNMLRKTLKETGEEIKRLSELIGVERFRSESLYRAINARILSE